jgi:hypothetical protein
VQADLTLSIGTSGVSADLAGTFTFEYAEINAETVVQVSAADASVTLSLGGISLVARRAP